MLAPTSKPFLEGTILQGSAIGPPLKVDDKIVFNLLIQQIFIWKFYFFHTKAGKLLLTALSHLLYLFLLSFLPPLCFSPLLSFPVPLHLHTVVHCMASACCLFSRKNLFHKHSLFNVLSFLFCICAHLSFTTSLFFPAFFLSLPLIDIMLLYLFSLLCLCYMFSLRYSDHFIENYTWCIYLLSWFCVYVLFMKNNSYCTLYMFKTWFYFCEKAVFSENETVQI